MARHGERIRKRKDGRWEGRYKIGNAENGKTIYKSLYGKTYTEVKEKLREAENNSDIEFSTKQKGKLFSCVVESWFASVRLNLKKSTIHKYEYLISKHILPDLGDKQISKFDANTVNSFAERKLEKGSLKKGKDYPNPMLEQ